MAVKLSLTLALLALAAVQVTWGQMNANEATERNIMSERLNSINRTIEYVSGILRHTNSNMERLKQGADYPNYDLIREKLATLRRDLEQVSEKVDAAINSEGKKMTRHIKAIKTSTKKFHKTLKGLTSDLKNSAKSAQGQMRTQINRDALYLERGSKALTERVKRLSPPAKRTEPPRVEEASTAFSNESIDTSLNQTDVRFRSLVSGGDEDPRLARQEVARTSLMQDAGRTLMDFDRMESYLDRCPSCMERLETYQCPLHGPALDMQKWARQLQNLISFGCAIPDGCDGNRKCCISTDPEVQKALDSVTKTLKDLYLTFQKGCTKCNKKLQDEAQRDEWTSWGAWSSCDVTCGRDGRRTRERRCMRLPAREVGDRCEGPDRQVGRCPPMAPCEKIEWTSWGSWSSCDVTCGRNGRRKRERECISSPSRQRSNRCSGSDVQMGRCPAMAECERIEWTSWGSWSSCDVTCGQNGRRKRERQCISFPSRERSSRCSGAASQVGRCPLSPCPVRQPEWSSWGQWSACSVTCDRGVMYRTRSCQRSRDDPTRTRGCPGEERQRRECDTRVPCCVNGSWSNWGSWETCSTTCGRGQTVRRRYCNNPAPNHCGRICPGTAVNTKTCNDDKKCCVDGNWSPWGSWSACSKTCGLGKSERRRICNNPAPNECGKKCPGSAVAARVCGQDRECCKDGNWGSWLSWSACSATCGNGVQSRLRHCDNPEPNFCGRRCEGRNFDRKNCNLRECCVDGNWSNWGRWTQCSATCGTGRRQRVRQCSNPSASACGRSCPGPATETDSCLADKPCEVCVDGNWSQWQAWSACSVTCGNGRRTRIRKCDNPPKTSCGKPCPGDSEQAEFCYNEGTDGSWGQWEAWSSCSMTCGPGERTRRRVCDSPAPDGCGFPCMGPDRDKELCNERECCVDGNWGFWQSWSACSVTCGRGERQRERFCDNPSPNYCGRSCPGRSNDIEPCDSGRDCCVDGNWGMWTSWSQCPVTCGESTRRRTRECDNPAPNNCGRSCPGDGAQVKPDICGPPAIDGKWSQWEPWSACSATCGVGSRMRSRSCGNPAPNACGKMCNGVSDDRQTCVGSSDDCECELKEWASWEAWGSCSETCGYGVRRRERECVVVKEGRDCGFGMGSCGQGDDAEVGQCLESLNCEGGALWAQWESWGQCSCRTATRSRRRECRRSLSGSEVVEVSPNECSGDDMQEQACRPLRRCPDCLTSCEGKVDGQYPTCMSCRMSVKCSRGIPESFMECAPGTEWDDFLKECVTSPSPSCMVSDCCNACAGKPDGSYHSCAGCNSYVECLSGQMRRATCPGQGEEWNQISQRCEPGPSPTCQRKFAQYGNLFTHDHIATLYANKAGTVDQSNSRDVPQGGSRIAILEGTKERTNGADGTMGNGQKIPVSSGSIAGGGSGSAGRRRGTPPGGTPLGMVVLDRDRDGTIFNAGDVSPGGEGQVLRLDWGKWRQSGGSNGSSSRGSSRSTTYVSGSGLRGAGASGGPGSGESSSRGSSYSTTYVSGSGVRGADASGGPGSGGSSSRGSSYSTTYVSGSGVRGAGVSRGTGSGGSSSRGSSYSTTYVSGSGIQGTGASSTSRIDGSMIGVNNGRAGSSMASNTGAVTGNSDILSGGVVPVQVLKVPGCVLDCQGAIPGKYPSCVGCEYYVMCTRNGRLRQRKCLSNRKWDDNRKKCAKMSSTCP